MSWQPNASGQISGNSRLELSHLHHYWFCEIRGFHSLLVVSRATFLQPHIFTFRAEPSLTYNYGGSSICTIPLLHLRRHAQQVDNVIDMALHTIVSACIVYDCDVSLHLHCHISFTSYSLSAHDSPRRCARPVLIAHYRFHSPIRHTTRTSASTTYCLTSRCFSF